MNTAQKIAKTAEDTVIKQSDEIIDFLKQKGFENIVVHFGHSSHDDEDHPARRYSFNISVYAGVNLAEPDGQ